VREDRHIAGWRDEAEDNRTATKKRARSPAALIPKKKSRKDPVVTHDQTQTGSGHDHNHNNPSVKKEPEDARMENDTAIAGQPKANRDKHSIDATGFELLAHRAPGDRLDRTRGFRPADNETGVPHRGLPIVLSVPEENGEVTLKSINKLSNKPRSKLKQLFDDMWSANESRQKCYRRIAKHPEKYLEKPMCVRDIVLRGRNVSVQGTIFRDKDKVSADDRCFKAKEPCAYLVMHKGTPTLRIVPLPEDLRSGMSWRNLGFWVQS